MPDKEAVPARKCPMCGNDEFEKRRGLMDTRGMTFFGLDWANRGCTEVICKNCGYVMTFADRL